MPSSILESATDAPVAVREARRVRRLPLKVVAGGIVVAAPTIFGVLRPWLAAARSAASSAGSDAEAAAVARRLARSRHRQSRPRYFEPDHLRRARFAARRLRRRAHLGRRRHPARSDLRLFRRPDGFRP